MPKDTRTRFQGVYARHKQGCAVEQDERCSCSPSYWGVVYDRAAGRQRKTAFLASAGAANSARTDLQATVAAGRVPASDSMRVKAAVEAFLQAADAGRALNKHGRSYKPSAVRDLRGALDGYVVPALGAKRLADLRRRDVQLLVEGMSGKSGSRVRTVVNAIRSLYAWAQDRELVDHDPAARVRLPAMNATPRDRVATVQQMSVLLAALESKDALPFALSAYATARRAEIRHALVEDVDLGLGVVYLGVDERGRKSRASQRAVPLVKPLSLMIRRRLMERGRPAGSELLCPGEKPGGGNSGMLSFEGLQTRVDAVWEPRDKKTGELLAARKVGDRITSHECRHTCASWLHAAGVLPIVVSELMGHAVPVHMGGAQITMARYTHVLPDALEEARRQFDGYLAAQISREATG